MQALFSEFFDATLYGSVMILLALLLRPVLRNAPRRILCVLWLFVMVRLLLPIQIESKLSLQPRFTAAQTIVDQIPDTPDIPPAQTPNVPTPEIPTVPDVTVPAERVWDLKDMIPVIWFGVMCIIFAYMAVSYGLLRYQLRDATPCEKGVWETGRIPGAFMLGYLRPQIYLPAGLDPIDRQLIIAHEKTHIRRGDVWWKLLGMLCLCLHWYNPLVWLAYALMSRDIETACDEQVISAMPIAQRKAYSYALLNGGKRLSGILVTPVAFAEVNLKQRIKKVLSYRNPGIWISVSAIVICALIVIFFMPDPTPDPQNLSATDSTQSTESTTETTGSTVHSHLWQDATCTAPKICTVCGATEGDLLEHNYEYHKCTVCGALLPTEAVYFRLNADQSSYRCYHYYDNDPNLVIPATHNGLPVTAVSDLCNNSCTYVFLPDSVTTISESAFARTQHLTNITLSQNLTTIEANAFYQCISLTQIHIPASVTSIGEGAFRNCYQLQSITYGGTMAQWNAIQKDEDWIGTKPTNGWNFVDDIPATGVTCTDGFVPF